MTDLNEILVFLQQNWQWMFALACVGLYFKSKSSNPTSEPQNKLEEIGEKASEILEEKAEEFVENVEEEALDALEEKLDSLDEQAMQVVKEVIELAADLDRKEEPVVEIEVTVANGFPDPANTVRNRKCPCGSGKRYKMCHAPMWTA